MILIDTSVWISFFKGEDRARIVQNFIMDNMIIHHCYISGELLLGGLSENSWNLIQSLPELPVIEPDIVFRFIRENNISGTGIGWVDISLLISVIAENHSMLTYDGKLRHVAERFGILL